MTFKCRRSNPVVLLVESCNWLPCYQKCTCSNCCNLQNKSNFNWQHDKGNYRRNLGRALGKGLCTTTTNIEKSEGHSQRVWKQIEVSPSFLCIGRKETCCYTDTFKEWIFFWNYKESFSIVLRALCGASYQFTAVHVGGVRRYTDDGVIININLVRSIVNDYFNSPKSEKVHSESKLLIPDVFVGDDAFPIRQSFEALPFFKFWTCLVNASRPEPWRRKKLNILFSHFFVVSQKVYEGLP